MPTRYKPITDHRSIEYRRALTRITVRIAKLKADLKTLLEADIGPFDDDDIASIAERVRQTLICFALNCNAYPLRTPRKHMATVRDIVEDPGAFLKNSGSYDPAVVNMIVGCCAAASLANLRALLESEIGQGSGPSLGEIRKAAEVVLVRLEEEAAATKTGGRPEVTLRKQLAVDLGTLYHSIGGHIVRSVHDSETGPFHRFLTLYVPIARPFARKAGFALTIETMVREAKSASECKKPKSQAADQPVPMLLPDQTS